MVQEIAFDREGLWNFGNDFARNVETFSVDNISSSHTLELWIDETSRLLIIPFFATLPNLIQYSAFINFE